MKRRNYWTSVFMGTMALVTLVMIGDRRLRAQPAELAGFAADSPSYVFKLELDTTPVAEYSECSGLGSGNDIEESTVQAPDGTLVRRKIPGALEWPNITLKRVGPSGAGVWSWRKAMVDRNVDAAIEDGAIIMFPLGSSEPIARWEFENGWAARLTIEGTIETLTIVHEGLERVAPIDGPSGVQRR